MNTYTRLPISFTRGKGVYLYDGDNKSYLDALAGIAVCGLGHAHPELVAVLAEQSWKLWHTSNLFTIPQQERAAETLCRFSGMKRAYFCNSGTEANEAAIKLTRLHACEKGIDTPLVLTCNGGFHGRTFGAMAATANPKIRAGFEPHLQGFSCLPFNDLRAFAEYAGDPKVVAVMVECVQGEGGVHPADPAFLRGLRRLCDEQGWLLICDEIQIGILRSGKWFGYQHAGIVPDIVTLAKGLGNGIPVGACLARGAPAHYFRPGMHGATFGGAALAMAVVNKVLELYSRDGFVLQVDERGRQLQEKLRATLGALPVVREIRGIGLMLGIELTEAPPNLVARGLQQGVVINVTAGNVLRLLPPLIFSEEHCDRLAEVLHRLLTEG